MSSNNQKYSVGSIALAEPYFDYVHTLPLVTFSDVKNTVELALVYNSQIAATNYFNIADGYKLNLQKKIDETSTGLSLLDSNGLMIKCNPATNQTTSSATVYALNDDSHRILRRITSGFELEYPDYSKEYFDSEGKQTSSFDKYGEEIFRFEYESSGELKSIAYRPEVGADYKKFEFSYSSNRLTTITYSANEEPFVIGTFVYSNTGLTIQHYSGVNYVCSYNSTDSIYTVFSTESSSLIKTTNTQSYSCCKTQYAYSNTSGYNKQRYKLDIAYSIGSGDTNKDQVTYDLIDYYDNNEIKMMEITDFYGDKTRIQYVNHHPCFEYEIKDNEDEMFNEDGVYLGNVRIQKNEDTSGVIFSGEQHFTIDCCRDHYRGWRLEFDEAVPESEFTKEAVVVGWMKWCEPYEFDFIINNGDPYAVNIEAADKWHYFCVPFKNTWREIDVWAGNVGRPETKDVRILFVDKNITRNRTKITNASASIEFDLSASTFKNTPATGNEISGMKVTGQDLLRYIINRKKNQHTNEFYYDNGRSVITNVGNIQAVDSAGNATSFSQDFVLTNSYIRDVDTLNEKHIFNTEGIFLVIEKESALSPYKKIDRYNEYLDHTVEITNVTGNQADDVVKMIMHNDDHLVDYVITEGVSSRTYTYDSETNCTALVSEKDEFNVVTTYTTDPIWGVVTKATVGTLAETESIYTEDGADLLTAKFGANTTQNNLVYQNGNVSSMQSGGINYGFTYENGNLKTVSKNGALLKTFAYANNDKEVTATTNTSATASYNVQKVVDDYGREVSLSNLRANTYALYPHFDENGVHTNLGENGGKNNSLETSTDLTNNYVTYYGTVVDNAKTIQRSVTKNGDTVVSTTNVEQDEIGRLKDKTFTSSATGAIRDTVAYATKANAWDTDNRVSVHTYSIDGTLKASSSNTYDALKRPITKRNNVIGVDFTKTIEYNKSRVQYVQDKVGPRLDADVEYFYDALGRITAEEDIAADTLKSYKYDMAGRLVRENNSALNKTYTYEYDSVGNVTSKKTHAYTTASTPGTATATTAFSYDTTHPDRLTSFGGKAITYDQQGCPLTYDGKTYTWTRGKLTKIATGGATLNPGIKAIVTPVSSESWTYTYNGNGQRTEKEYSYLPAIGQIPSYNYTTSSTTKFTYDHSGRLVQESLTENYKNTSSLTTITKYLYDDSGIIGMVYDGTSYYFHRNIQGDVVGVYNSAGTKVVGFTYDAYGNCTVSGDTSLAYRCKIRYRGYYFDTETGLYWVQTRYYNPEWCRWISPDTLDYLDPETAHGLNLYAYCGDDPVNFADPSGHLGVFFTVLLATLAGATFGAFKGVAKQIYNGEQWNWDASSWDFKEIGKEILLGSATGFAFGLGGVAGGIVKGSFQAITVAGKTLSVAQSVGFLLGTALTGNFVAGFAGYAIQNAGTSEKFNIGSGILEGIGQAGKGLVAFFAGGLYTASGFWKVGKGAKNSPVGLVVRAFTKYLLTMTPNNLLEELF